ncbi:hypothetical protein SUDANB120_06032 [Streptomyces sp. enrichment culture]|uniref:hypothetical protein n=1 Tax=Streptomyces TaxID=1883 RepID=UPI00167B709A|nr:MULTISPECIES: hypothetical protein [Streptomyces]MBD3577590.1 hypothetical protein [Streptomyces sp. KD18]GGT09722.1 hypothetical protein GCM10010286_39020 [Streptomyces toxytricini]
MGEPAEPRYEGWEDRSGQRGPQQQPLGRGPAASRPGGRGPSGPVPEGAAGRPRRRPVRTCLVAGLALTGLAVLAAVGLGAVLPAYEDPHRDGHDGDVRLSACRVDAATRWPSAVLVVTNRSSKPSDYHISVEFLAPGGLRLDEAHVFLTRVAPGQQARDTAQSLTQVDRPVTCRVTDVFRTASP